MALKAEAPALRVERERDHRNVVPGILERTSTRGDEDLRPTDGLKCGMKKREFHGEARQSAKTTLAHSVHVCVHHHLDELAKTNLGRPTELLSGFRRVALEQCHFRRPVEPLVDDDVLAPIETGTREGELGEF